jgi:hypothetical protein
MKRFTSPGHAQRFLSAFSGISPHFRPRRHRLTADAYRLEMTSRVATWNDVVDFPRLADTTPIRATPHPQHPRHARHQTT